METVVLRDHVGWMTGRAHQTEESMLEEPGIGDLVCMLRMTAESFTLSEQILLDIC